MIVFDGKVGVMVRRMVMVALVVSGVGLFGQAPAGRTKFDAFEVATVKHSDPDEKSRLLMMETDHRFIGKNFTLKLLIAAAYDLNPKTISGGPEWVGSEHYDIVAVTPGGVRPTRAEQMTMLRGLLTERFKLAFHREPKEFSIYELQVAKGGVKLKASMVAADVPPVVGPGVVYPQKIELPGRNASMADFVAVMQRAILDRPVVDKTGLTGRYDFDLVWAPDETQFGGGVPVASADAPSPPLFTAMQEELGLKMEATRGMVEALVVDAVERPSAD
jgi:uncharacterized protein (TIGR03435 family)